MLTLDFRRLSHQRQIHLNQFDRQVFQEMEGFSGADLLAPECLTKDERG